MIVSPPPKQSKTFPQCHQLVTKPSIQEQFSSKLFYEPNTNTMKKAFSY